MPLVSHLPAQGCGVPERYAAMLSLLAITTMANTIDEHLGNRLLRRRRSLGLTQDQVAAAIGVRFQQIQKYECGANKMSAARIWELAQALQVPVGYFYEGLAPKVRPTTDAIERRSV